MANSLPPNIPAGGRATLSVAIITHNEEKNLAATLASVYWANEIVIVDSGSTDRTAEIAKAHNAAFFVEAWKGFAAQKNSALARCSSDWVLSLDADEQVSPELAAAIRHLLASHAEHPAWFVSRRNLFLGRAIRFGGYYPDRKLRLIRRGAAAFQARTVHETLQYEGTTGNLQGDLIHSAYPTLHQYIEHMDRYSTLAAGAFQPGMRKNFLIGVLLNPLATFLYNYLVRGGCLDGREGLLLHLYHSVYVSWKYAKIWEAGRKKATR